MIVHLFSLVNTIIEKMQINNNPPIRQVFTY